VRENDGEGAKLLELLASVKDWREALEHVMACGQCKQYLRERRAEGEVRLSPEDWSGRDARVPREEPEAGEAGDRGPSGALFERLLAAPAEQRVALARSREFRNLALAFRLLAESLRAQPGDAERSEELARLALLAGQFPCPAEQVSLGEELRARAHAVRGNALRLLADWSGAEAELRRAAGHLVSPPDSLDRAFYCQTLALLRHEQGQVDDAVALAYRAARLYESHSLLRDASFCFTHIGFLLLEDGRTAAAVDPLTRACAELDCRDAALWARARLMLAYCHALLGATARARNLVEATRPLYERLQAADRGEMALLEADVEACVEGREPAGHLLAVVRESLLHERVTPATARWILNNLLAADAAKPGVS